jgi:hypothetical protein
VALLSNVTEDRQERLKRVIHSPHYAKVQLPKSSNNRGQEEGRKENEYNHDQYGHRCWKEDLTCIATVKGESKLVLMDDIKFEKTTSGVRSFAERMMKGVSGS